MKIKITHYGEPNDPTPDSNTRAWIGNHGNTLNVSSCALTGAAEDLLARTILRQRLMGDSHVGPLRLAPGALLKITFSDRLVFFRTFDDRAPEADPRVDLFNPYDNLPPGLPDFATVEVVT